MALRACPFCRELFAKDEAAACPLCGVAPVPLSTLPASHDALADEGGGGVVEEDHARLSVLSPAHGRGAIALLCAAGLVLFFVPWANVTLPEPAAFSGFAMARRIGWPWAAFVSWFVLLPTVWSRRTPFELRTARVAAGFLSLMPILVVGSLLGRPPKGGLVPVRFDWTSAPYMVAVLAVVAFVVSLRLGVLRTSERTQPSPTDLSPPDASPPKPPPPVEQPGRAATPTSSVLH
jgi:hypothetical protein